MTNRDERSRRISLGEIAEAARRGELPETSDDAPAFDVPEGFWEDAAPLAERRRKRSVHLRVDDEVFEWFRAQGDGHLTRMNAVLRSFYEAKVGKGR